MSFKKEDIVFIINPHSGKKKPESLLKRIKKIDPSFDIHITNSIEDIDALAKTIIDKYKVFVIAGGDGTINHFANYLFNKKDKIMAVIPRGSGNGFAKELGFINNIKKLINHIYEGKTLYVDVIEINGRKFINAAGIGFDSCVAHLFAQRKNRGLSGYIASTLKCMRKFKSFNAKLQFDHINIDDNFKMVTLANTRQFGNNALIAPKANPSSGKLDIVLVKPFPLYYFPVFIVNMFAGKIKESKYISYHQTNSDIEIEADYNKFHIDGDPIEFDTTTLIKIHPGSLKIIDTGKISYSK